jgi:hypothetical protein
MAFREIRIGVPMERMLLDAPNRAMLLGVAIRYSGLFSKDSSIVIGA